MRDQPLSRPRPQRLADGQEASARLNSLLDEGAKADGAKQARLTA